jgi:tetratricopeptide (TPR) repeat protein
MATSEIEKLERRYAENPHGLTFAPLAEVHRKIGDVPRALELLTAGLELHPNYIPASIVLGRCHQDQGDLAAAEAAFAHVLRLDDENVIALKSLADINERQERYAEAETWLRRLVAIDRSNDEAREQLERVEAARQSGAGKESAAPSAPLEPAPTAPPEQVPTAEEAPAPVLEMIDLTPEPAPVQEEGVAPEQTPAPLEVAALKKEVEPEILAAEPPAEPEPEPTRPELEVIYEPPEPIAVAAEHQAATRGESPEEPAEPDESDSAEEGVQPLPGLISAEFQPPLEATGGLGVETSEDVVLEVSGNSEFSVPDASEDLKSVAARLSSPRAPAPVEEREPTSAIPADLPPTAQPAPDFVLTETMAEVLAKQGHSEDALQIYRELLRRNGHSSELEARIRELEFGPVGLSQKSQSYSARDTNGQSVGAFFQAMLAARVGGAGATGNRGSTGRNEGAGQNGAAFLESSYSEEQSLPAPPAVPSDAPADAAVSFDDFFNSAPGESTPSRQGKGEPGQDDLDQFQTWLQNLKR